MLKRKPIYVVKFEITSQAVDFFYHISSLLVNTSSVTFERKPFYTGNFQISSQAADFHLIL